MAKITVIGSFVMDNVAKMRYFPESGETILGESLEFFPGGKGINQCVSIARLGGDVEMVGMLGNDASADVFRKIMQDENISGKNVFSCNKPTAVAQVQVNEEGQNRICVIPAANYEFGFEELDRIDAVIKSSELIVLQLELRLEVTKEIIRRAHEYGIKILFNPAPAVKLEKEILGMVDYITPNETELSVLTGMPTETDKDVIQAAKKLLLYGTKTVIATLGSRGALIATKGGVEIIAGYKVNVVDSVAAGDSFNGALAVSIIEKKSLKEAVQFANAMGALTVMEKGAIPSLHKRFDVEKFIDSQQQSVLKQ